MSAAPIPLYLLGDTATVQPWDEESDYANHYGEPETYSRVRLDTAVNAMDKTWANDDEIEAVLFVDALNSKPATPPGMRSKVSVTRGDHVWSGIVRRVRECIDDGNHIHHWEIGLGS